MKINLFNLKSSSPFFTENKSQPNSLENKSMTLVVDMKGFEKSKESTPTLPWPEQTMQ